MPLSHIQEHDNKLDILQPSPLPVKMTTSVNRKAVNRPSADDGGPNLVKVLELTEKELFNCKVQLKTKVHVCLISETSNHLIAYMKLVMFNNHWISEVNDYHSAKKFPKCEILVM